MPENKDNPSRPGVSYERQRKPLQIVTDVYEGTLRLREKAKRYLPQFPREPADAYQDRKATAVLYNAFKRTIQGLTGMVFRKALQLDDDVPDDVRDHMDNVDQAGRDLAAFAEDYFSRGTRDGHAAIFVDMARAEGERKTIRERRQAGLRPYWVLIEKKDLLSHRSTRIAGRHVLTQFVYRERVTVSDGDFAEKEVTRYRVYRRTSAEGTELSRQDGAAVAWEVWEEKDEGEGSDQDRVVRIERGVMDIEEIPLSVFYAQRTGFLESEPPMLDLALENVKHFQIRSDRDTGIHVTNNPVPVFIGMEADDVTVGSKVGIAIPSEKGDAKYMEPQGTGLSEAKDELRDIEQRMAALGLAMLQRDTRAAETAEARRIEKSETDSKLSTAAKGLEASLNEAIRYHALWLGRDEGGTVAVNRDFETQLMDPQTIQVLAALVDEGKLSLETLWELLEAGERLPEGFDAEQEMERILGGGGSLLDALTGPAPENGDGPPEAEDPEAEPAGAA